MKYNTRIAVKPLKARKNRKNAAHSRPTLGLISTWPMRRNGLRSRPCGRSCLSSTGWVSGSMVRTTNKLRQAKPVATHSGSGTAIWASCPPRKGPKMKASPDATSMRPKVRARCSGELMPGVGSRNYVAHYHVSLPESFRTPSGLFKLVSKLSTNSRPVWRRFRARKR